MNNKTRTHSTQFLVSVCLCGSVRVVVTTALLTTISRLTTCTQLTKGDSYDWLVYPHLLDSFCSPLIAAELFA